MAEEETKAEPLTNWAGAAFIFGVTGELVAIFGAPPAVSAIIEMVGFILAIFLALTALARILISKAALSGIGRAVLVLMLSVSFVFEWALPRWTYQASSISSGR